MGIVQFKFALFLRGMGMKHPLDDPAAPSRRHAFFDMAPEAARARRSG